MKKISVKVATIYGVYYISWSVSVYPLEKLDYPRSIFFTWVRIFSYSRVLRSFTKFLSIRNSYL